MLVVLAIIGMVAAMSLPLVLPMMRRKSIDQATEQVKSSLIFARSRAIQTQRAVAVTLLARERAIIVTDYDPLRDRIEAALGASVPARYCPHLLGNYVGADVTARADSRFDILKNAAIPVGGVTIQYLPEGCNFDLSVGGAYDPNDAARVALTYVFFPGGAAWTLKPLAVNDESGTEWKKTTLTGQTDKPAGPIIIGPQRKSASDVSTVQIVVYAMTGQVASEQLQ